MYEVFLNERRLLLADRGDLSILDDKVNLEKKSSLGIKEGANTRFRMEEVTSLKEMEEVVVWFRQKEVYVTETRVLYGDLPRLWEWFTGMFRLMPAAGGLVHSQRGFLFIYRKGKWDLPKGKIDRWETPLQAALREVTEETGVTRLLPGPPLPSTFHIYYSDYPRKPHEWILKETHWFAMEALACDPLRPETTEDIEEARWIQPSEIIDILNNTYPSLRALIRQASVL